MQVSICLMDFICCIFTKAGEFKSKQIFELTLRNRHRGAAERVQTGSDAEHEQTNEGLIEKQQVWFQSALSLIDHV